MNTSNQPINAQLSGRIIDGIAAPYDFSIMDVINEAWQRVSGSKAAIWGGLGFYLLVAIGLNILVSVIGATFGFTPEDGQPGSNGAIVMGLLGFVTQMLLYPLYAGILMLGIKRAVNLKPEAKTVFNYYNLMLPILATIILTIFIAMVPSAIGGIVLGIVTAGSYNVVTKIGGVILGLVFLGVGIYLAWSYIFAVQLIVEKRFGIWHALEASRRGVAQHWWKVFGFTWLLGIIYIISAIPLLLGLIWTLPLTIIALGVLYRRIFGIELSIATN